MNLASILTMMWDNVMFVCIHLPYFLHLNEWFYRQHALTLTARGQAPAEDGAS